jgi:hypothetical protein
MYQRWNPHRDYKPEYWGQVQGRSDYKYSMQCQHGNKGLPKSPVRIKILKGKYAQYQWCVQCGVLASGKSQHMRVQLSDLRLVSIPIAHLELPGGTL